MIKKILTSFGLLWLNQLTIPASALAQGQGQPGAGSGFSMFLPLILIFVIFYFLIVRPQQKQAKKRQQMLKTIEKGDEIITTGGIHGRITGVADEILTLEIADNCRVKIERSGIQMKKGEKAVTEKK